MDNDVNGLTVTHNQPAGQFEVAFEQGLAFLTYQLSGDRMFVLHTEVPEVLEGHGIGGKLAAAALDHARNEGLRVVLYCEFVTAYVERHPEYADLVAEE